MTDSRNITNPPSDDDPIVGIANEIAAHHKRIGELDRAEVPLTEVPLDSRQDEIQSFYERIFAAQDELTELRAQSVEGALVQLAAAMSIFLDIADNEVDAETRQIAIIRYRRLVYSAIPVLCDALGVDQDDLALPHFLEPWLNPWNAPRDTGGNVIRFHESH